MMIRSITGHNNVAVDMILIKNTLSIFLLLAILGSTVACGQATDDNLSNDQKKILNFYVSKYLLQDYQHLYYLSEDSLSPFLEPPLTSEDFKLPKFSTLPGNSQQYLDTLFSEQELQTWSAQIENYQPVKWNQELFPDSVTLIREKQIPDDAVRYTGDPPGHDLVYIHYISIPFIYNGKSAVLYSRKWSGGAYIEVKYHYFIKQKDNWVQVKEGRLNVGY